MTLLDPLLVARNVAAPYCCPVCGSEKGQPVTAYNDMTIAMCSQCGHKHVWPTPTKECLDQIYRDAYYQGGEGGIGFADADYTALENARRRMFTRHMERIEARVRPGRVLDVGCATGDFLQIARERGWSAPGCRSVACAAHRSTGRDPSRWRIPFRREGRCREPGPRDPLGRA